MFIGQWISSCENSFFLFLRCEGLISSPLCFTSGIREPLCCCWEYVGLNFLSVLGLIREIYVFCSFLGVMCCSKWHAWVCWLMMFVLHVQMEEIRTSILVKGNVIRLLQSKGQIMKLKKVSGSEWVFYLGFTSYQATAVVVASFLHVELCCRIS